MDYDAIEGKVIRTISPDEKMFRKGVDRSIRDKYYSEVGRSALECVDISLRSARMEISDVKRILDLPCGHGRVLRYFRAAFPGAEITACDIMRDGVDFCTAEFGAVPIYSEDDPRKIPIQRDAYDLIWVGSLLTHLDSGLWANFLDVLRSSLRPGGLLVFTTHGAENYRRQLHGFSADGYKIDEPFSLGSSHDWRAIMLYDYERTGFGFVVPTINTNYGSSLSSPAWVLGLIAKLGGLRTVYCSESAWLNHQDCFACVRDDSFQVGPSGITIYWFMKRKLKTIYWYMKHKLKTIYWYMKHKLKTIYWYMKHKLKTIYWYMKHKLETIMKRS